MVTVERSTLQGSVQHMAVNVSSVTGETILPRCVDRSKKKTIAAVTCDQSDQEEPEVFEFSAILQIHCTSQFGNIWWEKLLIEDSSKMTFKVDT